MDWMIYGANGYTGRLISKAAVQKGLKPILAGRNKAEVSGQASELGLASQIFSLDSVEQVAEQIKDCRLVLHCAGPFSATAAIMMDACIKQSVHYLDITGEIRVFEMGHQRDDLARRSDVVLIPGVGFDVVPSDCLAASLVNSLPSATELKLAFESGGGPSRGTAKTSVEGLANGGMVRKDGKLKSVPLAWKTLDVPFAHAVRKAVTIPWGDVYTAHVSTGIGDIEVYMAVKPSSIKQMRRMRRIQPLLKWGPIQSFMKKRIENSAPGPSADTRESSQSQLWGRVSSADGRSVEGTLTGPNGYDLTAQSSLAIVEYLMNEQVEGGFYTPSLLMGADFVSRLPDCTMSIGSAG